MGVKKMENNSELSDELKKDIELMEERCGEPDRSNFNILRCHRDNICGLREKIINSLGKPLTKKVMGRPIDLCPIHYLTEEGYYSNKELTERAVESSPYI